MKRYGYVGFEVQRQILRFMFFKISKEQTRKSAPYPKILIFKISYYFSKNPFISISKYS